MGLQVDPKPKTAASIHTPEPQSPQKLSRALPLAGDRISEAGYCPWNGSVDPKP